MFPVFFMYLPADLKKTNRIINHPKKTLFYFTKTYQHETSFNHLLFPLLHNSIQSNKKNRIV